MKKDTISKHKFRVLKRRLAKPAYVVVGVLELLWLTTQISAVEGDIGRLSNEEIAAALEWEGDADQLVSTLVESGWLDADPEFRLIVHGWSEHVPNYLTNAFKKHGKRFCDQIAKDRAKQGAKQDAEDGAKQDAMHPAPNLTYSSLTKPNLTILPETASPSSGEQPAMKFPCDGKDPFWELMPSQVAEWQEFFPSLDVIGECRSALAWTLANPTRRKTATGMRRFLVNWLTKSQNRSPGKAQPVSRVPTAEDDAAWSPYGGND